MTRHTIPAVEDVPLDDAILLSFSAEDNDGSTLELGGASIEWDLIDRVTGESVLSESDSGVTVQNRDNNAGTFEVKIDTDVTTDLDERTYLERVRITTQDGDLATWFASFELIDGIPLP